MHKQKSIELEFHHKEPTINITFINVIGVDIGSM